jgi:hypothetical protein
MGEGKNTTEGMSKVLWDWDIVVLDVVGNSCGILISWRKTIPLCQSIFYVTGIWR